MQTFINSKTEIQKFRPHILATIGNTPLVKLNRLSNKWGFPVFGKLESMNPGGSIKDRTAVNMLSQAISSKQIKPGDTIIESSSGNMALGLAQACKYYNLNLIVVIDPKVNAHTEKILQAYGGKLVKVTLRQQQGGYLESRLQKVKELLQKYPNSHWLNQYENTANPQTHMQTMSEIVLAMEQRVDYVFVSTSTCGTLMGCARYVAENSLTSKIIAVDALGSVTFGKKENKRLIPGHGSAKPSRFLKQELVHDVVHVSDEECILGCWELLEQEAILCGGSSGAIISAIEKYAIHIPEGSRCVAIFCDRGERYLETVYNKKWINKHFPHIRLPMGNLTNNG